MSPAGGESALVVDGWKVGVVGIGWEGGQIEPGKEQHQQKHHQ